jgi:alpha-1,2-mannosyltransferase
MYFVPFFMWFGWMSTMPHKEERFLFVVYPLVTLLAAYTLKRLEEISLTVLRKITPRSVKVEKISCVGE